MLDSQGQRITFPTSYPYKLAYTIRESLKAIADTKGENKKYVTILEHYVLRVRSDKIVFDPRIEQTIVFQQPIIEQAKSDTPTEIGGISTVLSIVTQCIKDKCDNTIFTDAQLDDTELAQLTKWCNKNSYTILSSNPLHIVKDSTGVEDSSQEDGAVSEG